MGDFADRMKSYEAREAGRRFLHGVPVMARLDGRAFHTWTRGLATPFDEYFINLMDTVCRELVRESNACLGYVQSDEITLGFYSADRRSQIYFDGRVQKMVSVLASVATTVFNEHRTYLFADKPWATFDCRVWQVPTIDEAANVFLWREHDCARNSILALGQHVIGRKAIHGMDTQEIQARLKELGHDWSALPVRWKWGGWFQRRKTTRRFTAAEMVALPPKHEALANPDLMVERTDVVEIDISPFGAVKNRAEVVLGGVNPILD